MGHKCIDIGVILFCWYCISSYIITGERREFTWSRIHLVTFTLQRPDMEQHTCANEGVRGGGGTKPKETSYNFDKV